MSGTLDVHRTQDRPAPRTLFGLDDVQIDKTALVGGEVPKWNAADERWEAAEGTVYTGCDTVTDDFNRADAGDGTLGMASDGVHRWLNVSTAPGGVWTTQGAHVNSAQASATSSADFTEMDAILNAHGNNQDITATVQIGGTSDEAWIIARSSADFGHFYSVSITDDDRSTGIGKKVPGQPAIFLAPLPAVARNTPLTVRVLIRDESISVFFDGSLVRTAHIAPEADETDWTYLGVAMGLPGGGAVDANTWVDDLSVVAGTAAAVPSAWQNITLLNSFTDGGGGPWPSPQYLKDSAGVVHLRGIVLTTGTVSTAMFKLPPGFRPSSNVAFVLAGDSGPNNVDGFLTMRSTGDAVIQPPMPTDSVELSGLFFYAED